MRRILAVFYMLAITTAQPSAIIAQVRPDPAPQICRELAPGDKWYPKYGSCCDTDQKQSVWRNNETGQEELYAFTCFILGVTPGPASLNLDKEELAKRYTYDLAAGIKIGSYSCSILSTSSLEITILDSGSYSSDSGTTSRYVQSSEETDTYGKLIKYAITDGDLKGFFLMLRDTGELALGLGAGWGKCYPKQ